MPDYNFGDDMLSEEEVVEKIKQINGQMEDHGRTTIGDILTLGWYLAVVKSYMEPGEWMA